jgi:hypothetical protein
MCAKIKIYAIVYSISLLLAMFIFSTCDSRNLQTEQIGNITVQYSKNHFTDSSALSIVESIKSLVPEAKVFLRKHKGLIMVEITTDYKIETKSDSSKCETLLFNLIPFQFGGDELCIIVNQEYHGHPIYKGCHSDKLFQ